MPENSVSQGAPASPCYVGSERVRERLPRDGGQKSPVSPFLGEHGKRGKGHAHNPPENWVCFVDTGRMEEKQVRDWFPGSLVRWKFREPNRESRRCWCLSAKVATAGVVFKRSRVAAVLGARRGCPSRPCSVLASTWVSHPVRVLPNAA